MEFKTIKELCTITKGATGISKAIAGEYPLVVTSEERKSHNEFQFDAKAVIVPLVSSTGHGHASLKRIHYQEGKFALGSILCAIIPKDEKELSAEFLYHFLNLNKERELVSRMKGMANVTLPIKEIEKIKVPVLTIDEQNHFVEYYSDIENHSNDISVEITHQLDLIKNLRQAFLREAMQGVLVSNETSDNKTGADLLAEIQAEKAQLVKEKKIKKPKPLAPISEDEIPFAIPKNWTWCRFGDINAHNAGKTLHKSQNKGEPYNYITTSNLYWGRFELKDLKEFLLEENELVRCQATLGDLLICEGGDVGRSAIWNFHYDICFQNHIHRVRPFRGNNNYNFYLMMWIKCSGLISNYEKGMGIGNLSGESLSKIIYPLPPLEIQERIVAKLDELMGYCDALEEQVNQSQQTNEMLLQQELREALGA
ncbi:restriction endonuclease subunit S [Sphingobacterium daejeonense]|uniref:restriction endonuclease subunit S n=1 Tax=Sphingobacterium daejeonense TaxID=371142 RepID=UPI0021A6B7CD|nr:restriction endonuclease subunit S [Sphingobacterium daejeonense]MCT1531008.1 restriction endonuclease subunit S [Sphingobacterium daejeonense]